MSQHPTSLYYLQVTLTKGNIFKQKGWVSQSKIIYINNSSTRIKNNNQYHQVHTYMTSTSINNNYIICIWIIITTPMATTHQQQPRHQWLHDDNSHRQQQCNDINNKCNMHVVPFYARWMTSIPGHECNTPFPKTT